MARKKAAARKQKLENMSDEQKQLHDLKQAKHREEREARREANHKKHASKASSKTSNGTKDLLDLGYSDSGSESEEELKINEEYAHKLEYNKEREELERLQEKYKDVDIDEELGSSSSEDEDDVGELVDDEIDSGIKKVLKAIRENPDSLVNSKEEFYRPIEKEAEIAEKNSSSKEKPMHLKDYHRLNYLNQEGNQDGEEEFSAGMDYEEQPFAVQQREEREKLVKEIHNAAAGESEDDNDDDGFLTKREVQRDVEPLDLPDPDKDSEAFLEAFMDKKAWIPRDIDPKTGKPVVPTYKEMVSDDEEDEELEEINDQFENAYNFRFEDPEAAELVSYARNQNTLRRQEQNSRKRGRERKRQIEREREEKRRAELKRLKALKVKEVTRKFELLKDALGDDSDVVSRISLDQLEGEFDETEWDKKMQEVFNEEFYAKKDHTLDNLDRLVDSEVEDEDIKEPESHEDKGVELSKKKQLQLEKAKLKAEKQKIIEVAEQFVEENIDLVLPTNIREEAGPKFKYREVSPDSFGLTAKDILLADDKQLNDYVGLKKLATFRDEEKKEKDKKKYAKKKRLREWRKSVFDTEDEPADELIIQKLVGQANETSSKSSKKKRKHKRS